MTASITRCRWATTPGTNTAITHYHDHEWGVPVHDERTLFEFLVLEGAQAGLSWSTVLNKREHYRQVFDHFDVRKVAAYDDAKVASLLADAGIIRNRLKIAAAINNAQRFMKIQQAFGSFDAYLWGFVDGKPLQPHRPDSSHIPVSTEVSDRLSKDLKRRGFKFVGSTICYAMMQAVGMVNDHTLDCYRHKPLSA